MRVEKQFRSYIQAVFPRDIGGINDIQLQEMRRAFYAGAYATLGIMIEVSEIDNEETGIKIIESVKNECQAFSDRVLNGMA